jgi:hypothetical protein
MNKTKLSQQLSHVKRKCEGWGEVIEDAELQLRSLKDRERKIKAAIRLFKQKQESGEPLPAGLEKFRVQPSTQN